MAEVRRKPGEDMDSLIQRFNKKCVRDGIFRSLKKRESFEGENERKVIKK